MKGVPRGDEVYFVDILQDRRVESDILWASRKWNGALAYNKFKTLSPDLIKLLVLRSHRLRKILKRIFSNDAALGSAADLTDLVKPILNEIGYDRKISVLRWLGFFAAKILKKLLSGAFVNEAKLLQIKSEMGCNPLLFIPSHKSYCDFILMSYICFHYEVDIPRIAAGMDFQSMALIGNVLRDACAFFMRRSFVNDELYSAVFSQYVHTLIVNGNAPIEFFIEGTRSRTQKSLMPKYGFLSMTLRPFIIGLVPDITIVPINLSYDRVLEEVLFAYELLGMPKPKETTKGFIKALSILNENYGNIYVQFGDPISVKKYFSDKIDRSVHDFGSVEMQEITQNELKYIINLAHSIVRRQRELTSLTCFNLVAVVLNDFLLKQSEPPYLEKLIAETQWLFTVINSLLPKTLLTLNSITEDVVVHHLNLHRSLIYLSADKKVQLSKIHLPHVITELEVLKGHEFSNSTMDIAIPILMLQYYANLCANFLIGISFIALIFRSKKSAVSRDELLEEFGFLCSVFSYEFVFHSDFIVEDFNKALDQCKNLKVINAIDENKLIEGNNKKLSLFCINILNSYAPGYLTVIELLLESVGTVFSEKEILKSCQRRLESKLNNGFTVHPANFSLDLLANALQSFVSMKIIFKEKRTNGFSYWANKKELEKLYLKLKELNFYSEYNVNFRQQFSTFIKANL